MYNVDDLDLDADYIVCDDIPYERFPAFKAIVGCQNSFVLTDRYRKKITIENWDKPLIICINPDMDYEDKMDFNLKRWFRFNVFKCEINESMF